MDVLSFRVDKFDNDFLKQYAKEQEITVSALINAIVNHWVDEELLKKNSTEKGGEKAEGEEP